MTPEEIEARKADLARQMADLDNVASQTQDPLARLDRLEKDFRTFKVNLIDLLNARVAGAPIKTL